MRVPKNIFHNQPKDNTAGLFNMIHSKFTKLGHGYHGAPIQRFQYHMDDAKWISIEPIVMGKVVVSNTCPEVNDYSLFLQCYSARIYLADILFQIPDTFQFLHKGDRCPQQGKRLDVSKTTTASNTWTDSNALAHNGGVSILIPILSMYMAFKIII